MHCDKHVVLDSDKGGLNGIQLMLESMQTESSYQKQLSNCRMCNLILEATKFSVTLDRRLRLGTGQ